MIFGCATYEKFLDELADIECRYDDIDDVKYETEKILGHLDDFYLDD